MSRVTIYLRYSPRRNAELSESNETQLEYCHKWCRDNHHEVAGVFEDAATSGDDEDRPGLWNAVESLKRGSILLVHKADRLARSVYLDEHIRRIVAKKGARIEAANGSANGDEPHEVLTRQILAVFAEYEKKVIAARTKATMLRHQGTGRMMGSIPQYGWVQVADKLVTDESGKLISRKWAEKCPQEQAVIEKIAELKRSGRGVREIARMLNADGIRCRSRDWDHVAVLRVLKKTTSVAG